MKINLSRLSPRRSRSNANVNQPHTHSRGPIAPIRAVFRSRDHRVPQKGSEEPSSHCFVHIVSGEPQSSSHISRSFRGRTIHKYSHDMFKSWDGHWMSHVLFVCFSPGGETFKAFYSTCNLKHASGRGILKHLLKWSVCGYGLERIDPLEKAVFYFGNTMKSPSCRHAGTCGG